MAKVLVTDTKLIAIGDAIRGLTGGTDPIKLDDMPNWISQFSIDNGATIRNENEIVQLSGEYDGSPVEIELGETWKSKKVPNTGYVEKVYFNTNLNVDEVVSVLSKLDYDGGSYAGWNEEAYYILTLESGLDKLLAFKYQNKYCIFDFDHNIIFSSDLITEHNVNFVGWKSGFNGVISINSNVVATQNSIGRQNEKIKTLISTTPFEKVMSNTINLKDYIEEKKLPLKITADVSIPSDYIKPTGTIEITENGEYNVTNYAVASVNVSTSTPIELSTSEEMDAVLISTNVGNIYKYVGTTNDTYTNGDLYQVIEEA